MPEKILYAPISASKRLLCQFLLFAVLLTLSFNSWATIIKMETPLGDVEIQLFDDEAPVTVANFLKYLNDGDFKDSFLHRSDPGFVIQGGAYTWEGNGNLATIPSNGSIVNEFGRSNLRGTLAMARLSGQRNSATSSWFINLADNTNLDAVDGGFTVFGEVLGDGMDIIDAIAALQVWNAGGVFAELPLINFVDDGTPIQEQNLVFTQFSLLTDPNGPFVINAGVNDSWFNRATAGQGFFITVFPGIKKMFVAWFTFETSRPDGGVPVDLGDSGHRWITAFGSYDGDTATLEVEITRGGVFNEVDPKPTQVVDGTMTIVFDHCNSATVTFNIPSINKQGDVPIERISRDNVALCEELNIKTLAE